MYTYDINYMVHMMCNDSVDPVCYLVLLSSYEVYGHGEPVSKPLNRILSQADVFPTPLPIFATNTCLNPP